MRARPSPSPRWRVGADAAGAERAAASSSDPAPPAVTASRPAPASTAAPAAGAGETGVTAAGTVDGYRPVTDAMLRDPDPDDWLMIRGNYQAWSHSRLADIDRGNVGDLELAWIWALPEGGWNAPSPIAHDGVLYVTGIGPVVQALDAVTGDLIWEHRVAVDNPGYSGTSRNLAIYGERLFLATPDARLVALDARTGEQVWAVTIARSRGGLPQHERAARRRRDARAGAERLRPLHPPVVLHQRLRPGHRRAALALPHDGPLRRARRQHLGRPPRLPARRRRHLDHRQLRPGPRPRLLRGGAGQAVGRDQPRHDRERRGALHQLHGGDRPRRRRPRLVLPARPGGDARPRRGLRAGARGRRAAQDGVQRREARHPLEAGPRDGGVPRLQGDGLPERLRPHRPRDGRRHLPAGHRRRAVRRAGPGVPEHGGRQELAPDELPPGGGPRRPAAGADLHGAGGAGRCRSSSAPAEWA